MSIHQEIALDAAPARVYELLTDSERFAAAAGKPATIRTGEGAPCSMLDSLISERDIELVPRQRVVQACRALGWERGAFSLVRLTLTEGGVGNHVTLDHEASPDGKPPLHLTWHEHLSAGWTTFYFELIARYLAAQKAQIAA